MLELYQSDEKVIFSIFEEDLKMSTVTADNRKSELEFFCLLNDIKIDIKDIHSDWVLLTYDIPNTKEGSDIRREFLNKAKWLGAIQHTESVYMMPWTKSVNNMIVKLSAVGEIFIFYTNVNQLQAVDLTSKYDTALQTTIHSLESRLNKMNSHAADGHYGQVRRMSKITWEKVQDLIMAATNRGSENIANQLQGIIGQLKAIDQSVDILDGDE